MYTVTCVFYYYYYYLLLVCGNNALVENRSMKRYGGRSFSGVGGTGRSYSGRWRNTNYFSERSDTKNCCRKNESSSSSSSSVTKWEHRRDGMIRPRGRIQWNGTMPWSSKMIDQSELASSPSLHLTVCLTLRALFSPTEQGGGRAGSCRDLLFNGPRPSCLWIFFV